MNTAEKILNIFKENNIQANEKLHKRIVMDTIKSWGLDVVEIRNAWHALMGYGLLMQVGDELVLTKQGESVAYKNQ
ncbi:MAG TPA: hypothetical protein PK079_22960 [Leptospiraceae bacterium]|nr:hypothetical protein [Leptospiraceae bacterium]HMW05402.1 hypothetical protein [Leptospiraceae bacterium]HMX32846.1 hypothetical protein [Leptospiraceae bacterium]HMY33886.1 hypothetical protein [Leptospiraceae bacterium]HMZ64504.1 hypothetical protein [Leptospiraceae bacterium]